MARPRAHRASIACSPRRRQRYTSRSLVGAAGGKLSRKTRALVEREIAAADAMLKLSTKPDNPALLRAVDGSLRRAVHQASKEMYQP